MATPGQTGSVRVIARNSGREKVNIHLLPKAAKLPRDFEPQASVRSGLFWAEDPVTGVARGERPDLDRELRC